MKIFCIGRNYAKHAKELGNAVPTEPVVFSKFRTSLLLNDKPFFFPQFTKEIHHELELVIRVCRNGKHVEPKFAHKYYDKIAVGLDFTARDLQSELKEKAHPWEKAKAFDQSAPISDFISLDSLKNRDNIQFHLEKNGETVQAGESTDMIFDFDALIVHLSKYFLLQVGDLIFTGTPAGVGPIAIGDELIAFIEQQPLLKCRVK